MQQGGETCVACLPLPRPAAQAQAGCLLPPCSSVLPSPPFVYPGPSRYPLLWFVTGGGHPQKEKTGAFPKWFVPHPPPNLQALKFLPGSFRGAWLRQWHPRVLNSESHTACERTGVNFPLLRGSSSPHLPPFRRACRSIFHLSY